MELNRQRKAYMGILAVAVGGLLVDRFVLGSAGPASASAAPSGSLGPILQDAGIKLDSGPVNQRPTVAERLNARSVAGSTPALIDAFAGEPSWLPRPQAIPEAVKAPPPATIETDPLLAARRLKLTSVFGRDDQGSARVNGKVVKVGESVDGFTLVRIDGTRAIFSDAQGMYSMGVRGEVELFSNDR